jgi:hypothetical protein
MERLASDLHQLFQSNCKWLWHVFGVIFMCSPLFSHVHSQYINLNKWKEKNYTEMKIKSANLQFKMSEWGREVLALFSFCTQNRLCRYPRKHANVGWWLKIYMTMQERITVHIWCAQLGIEEARRASIKHFNPLLDLYSLAYLWLSSRACTLSISSSVTNVSSLMVEAKERKKTTKN